MKLTAVEWLVDELNKNIGLTKFVVNCDEAYKQEILGIIQQAKEMERGHAQLYAIFCIRCIKENLPVIRFEDFIKLEGGEK
jgi:hypothetical protein